MLSIPIQFFIDPYMRFHKTRRYFFPKHYTIEKFGKNISMCNKIYFLDGVISFNCSKAVLLFLDKTFYIVI